MPDRLAPQDNQYSLAKIIGIWFLATAPMSLLAFVATPAIIKYCNIPDSVPPFLVFWPLMTVGLIWQFVLSLILVRKEMGSLSWQTIRARMWYNQPRDPKTGKPNNRLFWWVIPFVALSFGSMFIPLPDIVGSLFPFVNDLPEYNLMQVCNPQYRGAWWLLVLTLLTLPFNYFLGEEFLFRGILLPKMRGVFGKWDWFFNGVVFALYHLHKPHGVVHQALFSGFILSFPARRFKSNWMAVIIHGVEGLVAVVIVLGVILGMVGK